MLVLCSEILCPYLVAASLWTAVVVRTFFQQPFNSPSEAMVPSLVVGDHFFVSKTAYGYSKYSLPSGLMTVEGRTAGRLPERGEIVVFKLPSDGQTDYVKRLIGLPGDRIQMIDSVLYINGSAVDLKPVKSASIPCRSDVGSCRFFREMLPNGRSYLINDIDPEGIADNTEEYVVPERHYFMLGDNRDNSQDSRFVNAVGFVPWENLIGPVHSLFWNSRGIPVDGRLEGYPGVD